MAPTGDGKRRKLDEEKQQQLVQSMAEQPAQLALMAINTDEREVQASPSPSPLKRKRSSGRRKLPLEKIENKNARQVTFTKRRQGLFNKAKELSVLCGAHVEVLAFSPAGNPFSCAYPDNSPSLFAKVIGLPSEQSPPELIFNSQTALSQQLTELTTRLEAGKKKKAALQATLKRIEDIRSADVTKMEPAELEALKNLQSSYKSCHLTSEPWYQQSIFTKLKSCANNAGCLNQESGLQSHLSTVQVKYLAKSLMYIR